MRPFRSITAGLALAILAALPSSPRADSPYEAAIQYTLEKLVSGIHTESIFGGTEVEVTPLRTWKSVSGHYCREYSLTVTGLDGDKKRDQQTRCRDDGYWKLVPKN